MQEKELEQFLVESAKYFPEEDIPKLKKVIKSLHNITDIRWELDQHSDRSMNTVKHFEHRIQLSTDKPEYESSRRSWIRSKTIALTEWEMIRMFKAKLDRGIEEV